MVFQRPARKLVKSALRLSPQSDFVQPKIRKGIKRKATDLGVPATAALPDQRQPLRSGASEILEPASDDPRISSATTIKKMKGAQAAYDNKKQELNSLELEAEKLKKDKSETTTGQYKAKVKLQKIEEKINLLKTSMRDMEKRYNIKVSKKGGGKIMKKKHGGMTHVGLSPAEMSRSGTMSEAKRERYMRGGGPIHTTFREKAVPRTEGREPEVDLFPKVERKKGKKVGKKKQGYKARKDESIAMRVKKKRTKKQLKASRDESYGKWGKGKGKGKINRISSKQTDGSKLVASLYD